ncbi:ABC transporter substrate-binding protein [Paenibacillus sp. BR1-192]|uniref:ABC transporter substrate-binding protein n=2 Tax=unclassified Paenibacillus TaxID=185978 RepID=UPI00240CFF41|nr:ABC transporter substrate-binding protein [Paenibacillus sp. BR1-192]WFB59673.1 ABC transporter substrate-binding protein [Paenibacillus sp. BR1-192]
MKQKWTLAFVMMCLLLAACSNGSGSNAKPDNKEGDKAGNTSAVSAPGTFPIVEEKVTLKVLAAVRPDVEDYRTNEFTKWLEEKTNVHLEWETVPESNVKEKLNLTLASGDYPDIFMNMGITDAQLEIYGNQGVFLPLEDLIEEHAVNTQNIFAEQEHLKPAITSNDGHIYTMPDINECYHCYYSGKLWIYKPWLDKLGLEMPTTTAEFYEVLKAFKTQDPNGNGIADEIPLSGSPKGWNSSVEGFLMNAFVYYDFINGDTTRRLYMNNGAIDAAFMSEQYREGLRYMKKLFDEGLINAEAFVQDGDQLKQLGANGDVVILGAAPNGSPIPISDNERWKDYVVVPPLKGPSGTQYVNAQNRRGNVNGRFVVSATSKHPEVAIRLADAFYDPEVQMFSLFGIEGEDWRKAEGGEQGLEGNPATFVRLKKTSEVANHSWNQANPTNRTVAFRIGEAINDPVNNVEYILHASTKSYEPFRNETVMVPPLIFNEAQSSELLGLQKTINDYVDNMLVQFVMGDANLEAGWDGYLNELSNMNIKRYLEIMQEAYDIRYKK